MSPSNARAGGDGGRSSATQQSSSRTARSKSTNSDALASRAQVAAYLEVLFEKVDDCQYASRHLLDRIARFAPLV
jgi:hypothetical protein